MCLPKGEWKRKTSQKFLKGFYLNIICRFSSWTVAPRSSSSTDLLKLGISRLCTLFKMLWVSLIKRRVTSKLTPKGKQCNANVKQISPLCPQWRCLLCLSFFLQKSRKHFSQYGHLQYVKTRFYKTHIYRKHFSLRLKILSHGKIYHSERPLKWLSVPQALSPNSKRWVSGTRESRELIVV